MIGINTRMNYAEVDLSISPRSNEISAELLTLGMQTKVGDIFREGCLDGWFDKQTHKTIPMLYGHKIDHLPIGEWKLSLTETTLQAKGTFYDENIQEAREVLWCLNEGKIRGVSTVFEILDPDDNDHSLIKKAGIFEASIVLFPWSGLSHWCDAEYERWYNATLNDVIYEQKGNYIR